MYYKTIENGYTSTELKQDGCIKDMMEHLQKNLQNRIIDFTNQSIYGLNCNWLHIYIYIYHVSVKKKKRMDHVWGEWSRIGMIDWEGEIGNWEWSLEALSNNHSANNTHYHYHFSFPFSLNYQHSFNYEFCLSHV